MQQKISLRTSSCSMSWPVATRTTSMLWKLIASLKIGCRTWPCPGITLNYKGSVSPEQRLFGEWSDKNKPWMYNSTWMQIGRWWLGIKRSIFIRPSQILNAPQPACASLGFVIGRIKKHGVIVTWLFALTAPFVGIFNIHMVPHRNRRRLNWRVHRSPSIWILDRLWDLVFLFPTSGHSRYFPLLVKLTYLWGKFSFRVGNQPH